MSEKLSHKANPVESANFVDNMHARAGGLSQLGKSLGEVDPIVAGFVDVDTKSQDFGRIRADVARFMADGRNKVYDDEHLFNKPTSTHAYRAVEESDDARMDRDMAEHVRIQVNQDHTREEANKAAQDYLVTQGDRDAMGRRNMDIFEDMHHRMVNPFAAATDIGRSMKAARQARKAKRDQS